MAERGGTGDRRRVMVVHGRNLAARDAVFAYLMALGLIPVDWASAVKATGKGAPHNLEAVQAAMRSAQAVVVVFTAEDEARLIPTLTGAEADDTAYAGQPRPNVLLEAGLAFALAPERTIIVELGPIRRASDLEGLNAVRLTNGRTPRWQLRDRLVTAGCEIAEHGQFLEPRTAGDFDAAVVGPSAGAPADTRGFALGSVPDGHLEAFRVTVAGRIEHRWFPDDSGADRWTSWSDFEGGVPASTPFHYPALDVAVTSGWPEHLEMFFLAADGTVWHRWWWHAEHWHDEVHFLGRPFEEGRAERIDAASLRVGHMEVQVCARDGASRLIWFEDSWRFADSARKRWIDV
jgi:Predicted nucleotide-binding protein containing TIR-like domain